MRTVDSAVSKLYDGEMLKDEYITAFGFRSIKFEPKKGYASTRAGKVCANGDASSIELFHLPHMKAFQGMLMTTFQSGNTPGRITLTVTIKGLKDASVILNAK